MLVCSEGGVFLGPSLVHPTSVTYDALLDEASISIQNPFAPQPLGDFDNQKYDGIDTLNMSSIEPPSARVGGHREPRAVNIVE